MKYFPAIIPLVLTTFLVTPACAQRDANTSSARAAYTALNKEFGHDLKERRKKEKKRDKKAKAPRKRKNKTQDLDLARERRSSLHF